jgi:hypothetical protein
VSLSLPDTCVYDRDMNALDAGNGIPTSALPTVITPKIFVAVVAPIATRGGMHSVPRGIDIAAGRPRAAERRELPVGIQTSAVSFDAACEPTNFATLEPVSPA